MHELAGELDIAVDIGTTIEIGAATSQQRRQRRLNLVGGGYIEVGPERIAAPLDIGTLLYGEIFVYQILKRKQIASLLYLVTAVYRKLARRRTRIDYELSVTTHLYDVAYSGVYHYLGVGVGTYVEIEPYVEHARTAHLLVALAYQTSREALLHYWFDERDEVGLLHRRLVGERHIERRLILGSGIDHHGHRFAASRNRHVAGSEYAPEEDTVIARGGIHAKHVFRQRPYLVVNPLETGVRSARLEGRHSAQLVCECGPCHRYHIVFHYGFAADAVTHLGEIYSGGEPSYVDGTVETRKIVFPCKNQRNVGLSRHPGRYSPQHGRDHRQINAGQIYLGPVITVGQVEHAGYQPERITGRHVVEYIAVTLVVEAPYRHIGVDMAVDREASYIYVGQEERIFKKRHQTYVAVYSAAEGITHGIDESAQWRKVEAGDAYRERVGDISRRLAVYGYALHAVRYDEIVHLYAGAVERGYRAPYVPCLTRETDISRQHTHIETCETRVGIDCETRTRGYESRRTVAPVLEPSV